MGFEGELRRENKHTIAVDFDGTLVENKWPEVGDILPGAKRAMLRFHHAGFKLLLFTARLTPYDPYTSQRRDGATVMTEYLKLRHWLDANGLSFMDIWNQPGKPGATVFIDDRAERYTGGTRAWQYLSEKVLMRLDKMEPEFPEFDMEATSKCVDCNCEGCTPTCCVRDRFRDSHEAT